MADFGAKKRAKSKGRAKQEMDFDAEWDSIPARVYEPPKEPTPPPREPSPSPGLQEKGKKKKKKKNKGKQAKSKGKDEDGRGGISEIYSADKTGHVIEYGIQHDEIRKQRAKVKAIKQKQREKKLEEKRKEEEALKRHQELLAQQRAQKKALKHKKRKSIAPKAADSLTGSPSLKPQNEKKPPEQIPKPDNKKQKSRKKTNEWTTPNKPVKRRLSKLKNNAKMEPTIDVYAKELSLLKEENVELKKQVKMGDFIKKKYDLLKNENTLFKQQVAVLNEENEALKEQNKAMKSELEELRSKLNINIDKNDNNDKNTSNILNKLINGSDKRNIKREEEDEESDSDDDDDRKEEDEDSSSDDSSSSDDDNDKGDINGGGSNSSSSNSSSNEWDEWEPDQICDWILSLDTKYKKYNKVLRQKLHEEEMHGSLLGELHQDDLDRYGIKNAKHKNNIYIQLQKLTKQDDTD